MKWGDFEITQEAWTNGKDYDLSIADEPEVYADGEKLLVIVEALIGIDGIQEYVKIGIGLVDLIKNYVVVHDLKDRSSDADYPDEMEEVKNDISIAIKDLKECIQILSDI
jgi:hypothetical protein